ncbi:MAG: hypothetical protein L6R40_000684 [Gallowayella cf. fulva]|nr:MAG: hypothetical protein L6R40_000684 [Xanthomendoza cf. fulva]
MSTPPTATLLILNLPPSILCGINLQTFTTTLTFLGIKSLPTGFHFLFTSPSASLSLRDGFWFQIPPSPSPSSPTPTNTIFRKWSPEDERLIPCSESEGQAFVQSKGGWKEVYEKHLTPYRQSAGNENATAAKEEVWGELTKHITPEILSRFTKSEEWTISSASSGMQDRDEIPGLTGEEVRGVIGEEKELGMLGIDLRRTWREGAVGRERTEGARDRSWLLGEICGRYPRSVSDGLQTGEEDDEDGEDGWGYGLLGQMELCFLMVLTLANYSCLEEWKRILALVLTCEEAVKKRFHFFERFLMLLKRQLERADDVEGGLFDMSDDGGAFLKTLLKRFKRTMGQHAKAANDQEDWIDDVEGEFEDLEKWVKEQYGWEPGDEFVRSGMLELEDGEMVEMETGEMEEEDESGEYAPIVVEL